MPITARCLSSSVAIWFTCVYFRSNFLFHMIILDINIFYRIFLGCSISWSFSWNWLCSVLSCTFWRLQELFLALLREIRREHHCPWEHNAYKVFFINLSCKINKNTLWVSILIVNTTPTYIGRLFKCLDIFNSLYYVENKIKPLCFCS